VLYVSIYGALVATLMATKVVIPILAATLSKAHTDGQSDAFLLIATFGVESMQTIFFTLVAFLLADRLAPMEMESVNAAMLSNAWWQHSIGWGEDEPAVEVTNANKMAAFVVMNAVTTYYVTRMINTGIMLALFDTPLMGWVWYARASVLGQQCCATMCSAAQCVRCRAACDAKCETRWRAARRAKEAKKEAKAAKMHAKKMEAVRAKKQGTRGCCAQKAAADDAKTLSIPTSSSSASLAVDVNAESSVGVGKSGEVRSLLGAEVWQRVARHHASFAAKAAFSSAVALAKTPRGGAVLAAPADRSVRFDTASAPVADDAVRVPASLAKAAADLEESRLREARWRRVKGAFEGTARLTLAEAERAYHDFMHDLIDQHLGHLTSDALKEAFFDRFDCEYSTRVAAEFGALDSHAKHENALSVLTGGAFGNGAHRRAAATALHKAKHDIVAAIDTVTGPAGLQAEAVSMSADTPSYMQPKKTSTLKEKAAARQAERALAANAKADADAAEAREHEEVLLHFRTEFIADAMLPTFRSAAPAWRKRTKTNALNVLGFEADSQDINEAGNGEGGGAIAEMVTSSAIERMPSHVQVRRPFARSSVLRRSASPLACGTQKLTPRITPSTCTRALSLALSLRAERAQDWATRAPPAPLRTSRRFHGRPARARR
jgi:hypothetical protein